MEDSERMAIESRNNELLDRARNVIRELREKLVAAEARTKSEPIAIIGMAGRFPGAGASLEAFWQMIQEGRDAVRSVPAERWDGDAFYAPEAAVPGKMNTRHAAFLDDVSRFDAAFFDVTPREAITMDPQQRIFLETAWHALEDAGLPRAMVSGTDTGVFVGVHSHSADYCAMQFADPGALDGYAATGTAQDMIAGRLAYWLDLRGPSLVVNTACSSSLAAVHLACRSLRSGESSAAVAGGIHLLLSPISGVAMSQLQMLAADGHSKTFDRRADGFGRGEGCGVVILKRLADAVRNQDRVLAIIRGSAMNQDGRTNGLTAPSGLAQQRLLRRALEDSGVSAGQVGYFETHGTGTPLGDPIEVEAIAEVLGGEQRTSSCTLGSIKANIGHLEGGAGIAGLIKTVLVLRHGYLPPVANLQELNPHLAFSGSGLSIPAAGRNWPRDGRRFAGVNSFGWSGANVHVVLEEAPEEQPAAGTSNSPVLVAVSAQNSEALRALAAAFAERIEQAEAEELPSIGYTSTMRRTHHPHRIAAIGSDGHEIASALRRRAAGIDAIAEERSSPIPTPSAAGSRLKQLAESFEQGGEIDWKEIYPTPGRTVSLPQYPFQGKRYWLKPSANSVPATSTAKAPDDWFYGSEWIEKPLQTPISQQSGPAFWLLLKDCDGGFANRLAAAVRQRGDRTIVTGMPSRLTENPLHGLAGEGLSPGYIVMVAEGHATGLTRQALALAQSVVRSKRNLKLWFITHQAQRILKDSAAPQLDQAALWGFARAFGLEYPQIGGGVIDLDLADQKEAVSVINEIVESSGEDRVALRHGRRFVPRLKRLTAPPAGGQPELRQDGCYLITGAFGSIGLDIAEWLAERGARHLVLVGRRDPQKIEKPGLKERLDALRAQGISLRAEACDVSDEAQIQRLFSDIDRGPAPLYGVVHAAAGMRFDAVMEATEEDVEIAFRAKVEGARLLDRFTRNRDLDFFVLFSSLAVSIGSRNASLYAAANSCLDALAAERRASGLAGLSVQWGLWEPAALDRQGELIAGAGFISMPSAKALNALGRLMVSGADSGIIAAIDWSTLRPALELQGRGSFVAEIIEASVSLPETDVKPTTDLRNNVPVWTAELGGLPPGDRTERLLALVSAEVRAVFGMAPDDPVDENRGLFQMGMDSLMSVKLKRRLEAAMAIKLPGTLTLTYPTITALAGFLEGKVAGKPIAMRATIPAAAANRNGTETVSVSTMTEAEADAALAAELAAIQQKLGVY